MNNMDIYSLSRNFWNFSFENPEKMKPIHSAIFFFAIEHSNRLWWKEKFWFPTTMVMDAIWVSNYSSYKKWLDELVDWGFIKMIQVSKNQYSANIISLIQFVWSTDKALDKALIKHGTKQHIKHQESIASIDIQVYKDTKIQETWDREKSIEVLQEHINTLPEWTTRHTFYSSILKNIDTIKYTIDTKAIEAIEKKLWEFRTKLWDEKTKLELESFWEHHSAEKTEIKSLILRLNTWMGYSLKKA